MIKGLSTEQKAISAKYFYDDIGSELFQKISQHPDYYPTKTEFSILDKISDTLPNHISEAEIDIIELGAGDGHKSELIINGFIKAKCNVNFYPIDISEKAMQLLGNNLTLNENLIIHGVVADYYHGLHHIMQKSNSKKLVLFLGSNIGNFNKTQTDQFLTMLSNTLDKHDYVFMGFDLKKDPAILNKAYNDSDGLTKAFNLNLLTRINRELGGNFDVAQFKHYGFYNPYRGTMESYLISLSAQSIYIEAANQIFHFKQFEPIHLEYSHKFTPSGIDKLAKQNGFDTIVQFSDEKSYFIDALWQVRS
ncbi:MAG TPA: L-histidine N(alpha)-methyltransferase [Methylophilaceae bacterium]|nr:L-histidine N(alpha)-methyltransferase [Methylophilaceae bacterium]